MSIALAVLVLVGGISAVLLSVTTKRLAWVIVALAVGCQIGQFGIGVVAQRTSEQRALDLRRANAAVAAILYAISEKNANLSKILEKLKTGGDFRNDYVLGYLAFREDRYDDAKVHFANSLADRKFVAQSSYLLGYIAYLEATKVQPIGDLSDASKFNDSAIASDPLYGPAHYLNAILLLHAGKIETTLQELRKAAYLDPGVCLDLNTEKEVKALWSSIASDREFVSIRQSCKSTVPKNAT